MAFGPSKVCPRLEKLYKEDCDGSNTDITFRRFLLRVGDAKFAEFVLAVPPNPRPCNRSPL